MIERDWPEVLRSFELSRLQSKQTTGSKPAWAGGAEFKFDRGVRGAAPNPLFVKIPEFDAVEFSDGTGFFHITDVRRDDMPYGSVTEHMTHATMIWGDHEQTTLQYDETVGVSPPEGVDVDDTKSHYDGAHSGNTGTFQSFKMEPHRDDGAPAVICLGNLRRTFCDGHLHGLLSVDYIGLKWMQNGERYRNTGPSQILIEGYREFYDHGVMYDRSIKAIFEDWDREPIDVQGTTDPFANQYFLDPQDEVLYAVQRAS